MLDHSETVAVIAGGTQGLGLAIAGRLIDAGCTRLVISGRRVTEGEAAAVALRERGVDARFIPADMGLIEDAIALIDRAANRFGRVTALVNAAATTERGSILDCTPADFDKHMAVNARGPFFALQRFAQLAVEKGHPAAAVNILSMVVHCGQSFLAPYSASKAGLHGLTRAVAVDYSTEVRCNAVAPGWTVSGSSAPSGFQLDGFCKAQGMRSSMRDAVWPLAMAVRVARKYAYGSTSFSLQVSIKEAMRAHVRPPSS